MRIALQHDWNLSPREAIALQKELRGGVVTRDRVGKVRRVAGADVDRHGLSGEDQPVSRIHSIAFSAVSIR